MQHALCSFSFPLPFAICLCTALVEALFAQVTFAKLIAQLGTPISQKPQSSGRSWRIVVLESDSPSLAKNASQDEHSPGTERHSFTFQRPSANRVLLRGDIPPVTFKLNFRHASPRLASRAGAREGQPRTFSPSANHEPRGFMGRLYLAVASKQPSQLSRINHHECRHQNRSCSSQETDVVGGKCT